eukprot:SAG11_NODE_477_length_9118_cov_3.513582_8_plen_149_part_00
MPAASSGPRWPALAVVTVLASGAALLLLTFRAQWARAFSPDSEEAAALIMRCLPFVCLYIVGDAIGIGVLNFVLRAAGRVLVPGAINLASFCEAAPSRTRRASIAARPPCHSPPPPGARRCGRHPDRRAARLRAAGAGARAAGAVDGA